MLYSKNKYKIELPGKLIGDRWFKVCSVIVPEVVISIISSSELIPTFLAVNFFAYETKEKKAYAVMLFIIKY